MDRTDSLSQWLNEQHEGILAVVEPLLPEKWRQQPATGGWSAAEVFAHLGQAESAIQAGMKQVFSAEPRPVPFLKRFYIPPAISQWRIGRFQTPIPLDLSLLSDKFAMLEKHIALRQGTMAILEENRKRDLSRWRFPHPIFGYLDGYTWFKSIGYHEIRHTKQLREIVDGLQ
jgi:hypothetical protein